MKPKFDLAELARKWKLPTGSLKNPEVIGILEAFLKEEAQAMPRQKPGAVRQWNWKAYCDNYGRKK